MFVFVLFCFNSLDISANLFVVFPDSTQIAEMIPTYKTYYTSLNSHYVSKLCSCLVMLERKKNHLKINKKKKNHVYRG